MGKHDRKYLDKLHRQERRRAIIWGAVIAIVLVAGVGVIAGSALGIWPSSEGTHNAGTGTSSAGDTFGSDVISSEKSSADSGGSESEKTSNEENAGASIDKSSADEGDASLPLAGVTICIDPGHCAHSDSTPSPNNPDTGVSESIATEPGGTSGSISGPEYRICMLVARQLRKDYEATGAEVVMVRTKDNVDPISPKDRALIANRAHADAFVRLHCDSAGSSTSGFYTLVPADTGYQADGSLYKKSQKMGRFMHKRIVKELDANDRGITVRSDQGGFNWCKVPCVLFEMANMDNPSDDKKLATKSYRAKLARAICDATEAWFGR